jgi:hypothetical protein
VLTGLLVDMITPAPRFDPAVPRGLMGLAASAIVGGCISHLLLRDELQFQDGRAAFVGVACGALAGLFSVAASFTVYGLPHASGAWSARLRPVFAVLLTLSVTAPGAFLVCLAIRT